MAMGPVLICLSGDVMLATLGEHGHFGVVVGLILTTVSNMVEPLDPMVIGPALLFMFHSIYSVADGDEFHLDDEDDDWGLPFMLLVMLATVALGYLQLYAIPMYVISPPMLAMSMLCLFPCMSSRPQCLPCTC